MRILQIIDSLEIGGAEKMAVNYANALAENCDFSGLVATRKEGNLKSHLSNKVDYLFLNRESTLDFKAIFKLRKYCKENKIDFLQAHSSSFFTAFLVKLCYFKINIIWHDHNGLSEFISKRKSLVLKLASFFFKGIVVVNYQLKNWAIKELNCKQVIYLANFTIVDSNQKRETELHGIEGKKIVCVANLRFQKNHFLLIEVAKMLKESHPDWSFHLIGKDFNDDYSAKVKNEISACKLDDNVFLYGSKNDTNAIIHQANIAILTSQSEGLPVALLEYGLNKKPVVSTSVGEIPMIIKNGENGFLVPKYEAKSFYEALIKLIENDELRHKISANLYQTIQQNHSQEAIIGFYLNWLKNL